MRKGRVIRDVGWVWESLVPGDLAGWLEGEELQEDTYKRKAGGIRWETFFIQREKQT